MGELRHVYYDEFSNDLVGCNGLRTAGSDRRPDLSRARRSPGDFEVIVLTSDGVLQHWTKHNSWPWTNPPGTWYFQQQFGISIAFGGQALVQSRLGAVGSVLEAGQCNCTTCVRALTAICITLTCRPVPKAGSC